MRALLLSALAVAMNCCSLSQTAIPEYTYRLVHTYPHDGRAFTEGLFYLNGYLYEGTGLPGHSSIRKVELKTGRILQQYDLPRRYFGEGIVAWKNRLFELTYTTGLGFVYDLHTLKRQSEFHYPGEGWSMTHDGKRIIMDDGTPDIRFWDPETLKETGRLRVTANGIPVENLNELEWVNGEIFANIWHSNRIARIHATTGHVLGWIDLSGLLPQTDLLPGPQGAEQVLNGIAYDQKGHRLFVTGKYWPKLFEIQIRTKARKLKPRSAERSPEIH